MSGFSVRKALAGFIFIYINLGILTTLGANFRITAFCNNILDLLQMRGFFTFIKNYKKNNIFFQIISMIGTKIIC